MVARASLRGRRDFSLPIYDDRVSRVAGSDAAGRVDRRTRRAAQARLEVDVRLRRPSRAVSRLPARRRRRHRGERRRTFAGLRSGFRPSTPDRRSRLSRVDGHPAGLVRQSGAAAVWGDGVPHLRLFAAAQPRGLVFAVVHVGGHVQPDHLVRDTRARPLARRRDERPRCADRRLLQLDAQARPAPLSVCDGRSSRRGRARAREPDVSSPVRAGHALSGNRGISRRAC